MTLLPSHTCSAQPERPCKVQKTHLPSCVHSCYCCLCIANLQALPLQATAHSLHPLCVYPMHMHASQHHIKQTCAPSDRLAIHSRGSNSLHADLDQYGFVVMLRRHWLESDLEQTDALLNGQAGNATAKLIQHALLVLTASVLGAGCV